MKACPVCGVGYSDELKFCPADGQTLRSVAPAADLVGEVIADRYYVQRKLGEGGMGQVYLAEHVRMGRKSAIKVMSPSLVHDPEAIARFNREASNASRITHPNVCAIYDFGETAEGLIYLAMEYVDGAPLTALLEREGTLPLGRAVELGRQVADALQAAHDLGIVHRDLKPDNVMLTRARDGKDMVKVVDFGIAKAVGGDSEGQTVTRTGFVIGTPEFMSPEQLSGDPLNVRSDIYSLGLVCYRMITGTLPFDAESAQDVMVKRLTENPKPLSVARRDLSFPPVLQAVFDRVLARRPEDRYPSATHFARELLDAVGGGITAQLPATRADQAARTELIDARVKPAERTAPIGKGPRPTPRPRGRPWRWVAAVLVVGGVAAGAAVTLPRALSGPAGTDSALDSTDPLAAAPESTGGAAGDTAPAGQSQGPANLGQPLAPSEGERTGGESTGARTGTEPRTTPAEPASGAVDQAVLLRDLDQISRMVEDAIALTPRQRDRLQTLAKTTALTAERRAYAAGTLGTAYLIAGHLDSAIVWLERAYALNPADPKYLRQANNLRGQGGPEDGTP